MDLVDEINEWNDYSLRFVGIYSKNTVNYLISDVACVCYGLTVVPIYDTLGEEATLFAFNETKMKSCFISSNHAGKMIELKKEGKLPHLENLLILDYQNLAQDKFDSHSELRIIPLDVIINYGK